ncbi:magnesium transporter [Spiroplasma turonicum]|uniref:Magnesium transporter MgtE n=1 Tax=Spiroplasma turonicum TaxID=216946 RepID=A0A0K1P4V8_9MOLU|nr:magnesium transporter [Spiroplasma turonicum]AKU79323.1 Mg2+ transport protein [Spiroplasma turonicum]ALX70344.1 Mg2+ transport protein [Spiroplasma turonicum]
MSTDTKNQEIIDKINEFIDKHDVKSLRDYVDKYYPYDLAEALYELEENKIILLIRLLTTDQSAELFPYLDPEIQEEVIAAMNSKEISEIFENLYSDDIVDILEEMPSNIVKKILRSSTPESRAQLNTILKYDDDTVGSIMNVEYIRFRDNWTIKECIEELKNNIDSLEEQNTFFVVDKLNNLKGVVDLKSLLFESHELKVNDVMDERFISAYTRDHQETVIDLFKKYELSIIPVTNSQKKLVGVVTFDDVFEVIEEEVTEDIHKMAAITPTEDEYFKTSIWKMMKSRCIWLILLMTLATFTQVIIFLFLKAFINLDIDNNGSLNIMSGFFYIVIMILPITNVISSTSGNSVIQSSTMVVRAMSLKEVTTKDFGRVLWKEFRVSILTGLVLVFINLIRSLIIYAIQFKGDLSGAIVWYTIAITSIALFLSLIISKLVGGLLPLIAKKMKLDPAIMASPILSTFIDMVSVTIFFGITYVFYVNVIL